MPTLPCQFPGISIKRPITCEPFKHNCCISILIACRKWSSPDLFRRHVPHCSPYCLSPIWRSKDRADRGRNAKIGEPGLVARTKQDVLRFDIAVDDVVIMSVLQRSSNLKDDRQNAEQRLGCTLLKYLLDGSSWSIVHRQESLSPSQSKFRARTICRC